MLFPSNIHAFLAYNLFEDYLCIVTFSNNPIRFSKTHAVPIDNWSMTTARQISWCFLEA